MNVFDDFNYKHPKYYFNYIVTNNDSSDFIKNKSNLIQTFTNKDYIVLSN